MGVQTRVTPATSTCVSIKGSASLLIYSPRIRKGTNMRDIRVDLQDRANLIKKQMSAAQDQFDKLVERLKLEHQSRLKEPKAELEAIKLLTEKEHRRLVGSWSLAPQPQNPQLPSAGQDIMRPRPVR